MDDLRLTRRDSLLRLGGFALTAVGVAGLRPASSQADATVSCILTPEQTEGPY